MSKAGYDKDAAGLCPARTQGATGGKAPRYDFGAAYQRLLQVTGAASQTALATALGINQSSVWDVVRRAEGIPASWLVALVERLGISPLWIRTGQGPQRLTRSLGEIPLEELMAEIGRRHDCIYKHCAGSGVTGADAEG